VQVGISPVAFVNKQNEAGVSDIFMELSDGESSQIASIRNKWRAHATSSKVTFSISGAEILIDHIVVTDAIVVANTAVPDRAA
jgi:hypothetical protein